MKTAPASNRRPVRTSKLEARCSDTLRGDFELIARVREADISDLVREACVDWAARNKARLQPQLVS